MTCAHRERPISKPVRNESANNAEIPLMPCSTVQGDTSQAATVRDSRRMKQIYEVEDSTLLLSSGIGIRLKTTALHNLDTSRTSNVYTYVQMFDFYTIVIESSHCKT